MSGKLIWLMWLEADVIRHLKELEIDRLNNDIRNMSKYKPLYDVLYNLNHAIILEAFDNNELMEAMSID